MVESGPIPAVHGVVRWRLIDLAQWIFEEFRITIAKQTLSRELRSRPSRNLPSLRAQKPGKSGYGAEKTQRRFAISRKDRLPKSESATDAAARGRSRPSAHRRLLRVDPLITSANGSRNPADRNAPAGPARAAGGRPGPRPPSARGGVGNRYI